RPDFSDMTRAFGVLGDLFVGVEDAQCRTERCSWLSDLQSEPPSCDDTAVVAGLFVTTDGRPVGID
ncbi:hypothetical protein ABTE85_22510, partial [Acinetobacter baumannii]